MQDGGTKRRTLKEAIKKLEESGKTISDKDRKEMMKKPTGKGGMPPAKMRPRKPKASRKLERTLFGTGMPAKTMSDRDVRMGMRSAKTMSDRDVEMMRGMMKMKEGGKVTDFGKAFAKARRDFINKKIDPKTGKPAKATFMFQGKRFNVQTADDRKKTVTKVDSPVRRKVPMVSKDELKKLSPVKRISLPKIKAAAKVGSKRGLTAAQSRDLGLTGTQLRDKKEGLLEKFTEKDIKARKKQVASDTKAAQDKLAKQKKQAGTIVGGALAAVPTARAATAASKAVKAVGGAKGIKQAATRARGEIKKEMAGRKIGAGRKTTGDLVKGAVQQFTKKQPAIVKRQATIAAKKKKQAELAAKRKKEQSVNTKVKRLSKGARSKQFVNRASGGVFKGTF